MLLSELDKVFRQIMITGKDATASSREIYGRGNPEAV